MEEKSKLIAISVLKPHPKNYQKHDEEQLNHIIKSIEEHGVYRNVVIARDNTILAGHGVVEAMQKMGRKKVAVIKLDLDPNEPRALKVLTGDNEIGRLAMKDERLLTEMLREIKTTDNLLGTGFDEQSLAALLLVTRPASEIADLNAAAEWIGLPGYGGGDGRLILNVYFRNEEDRAKFAEQAGIDLPPKARAIWWPSKERKAAGAAEYVEQEAPPP
jgi:hypothetical protein